MRALPFSPYTCDGIAKCIKNNENFLRCRILDDLSTNLNIVIGGSGGGGAARDAPPLGPIFLIFIQFLAKNLVK